DARVAGTDGRGERRRPAGQRRARGAGREAGVEEGDLRRRGIARKAERMLELAHLERADPLAQDRLDRRLPARLDVQVLPEPLHSLEAVAREPGSDLGLAVHALLELAQRGDPGLDLGELRLGLAQRIVGRRAPCIVLLPLRARLLEPRGGILLKRLEL